MFENNADLVSVITVNSVTKVKITTAIFYAALVFKAFGTDFWSEYILAGIYVITRKYFYIWIKPI